MKNVILVCTLAGSLAWAQSPQVVQNTRAALNSVQKNATAASNQALGVKPAAAKDAHPTVKATAASGQKTAPGKPAAAAVKEKQAPKLAVTPVIAAPAKAKSSATKSPATAATQKTASASTPKLAVKQAPVKKESKSAPVPQKKAAAAPTPAPAAAASSPAAPTAEAGEAVKNDDDSDKQDKKWSAAGKRDPFISPVVNHAGGSGCSTGKKCLEIGAINLRGVVHSDAGFIAVVTNSMNKAYFLRENDPVFDGYVVKITGDSIIFKETLQDRLGKTFTREVTKRITTPAV